MKKYTKNYCVCALVSVIAFAIPAVSFGITAPELKQAVDANEKITIIDIRARVRYDRSHIPGAINIPAAIVDRKQLPPLGSVVVYGDGILTHITKQALVAINNKQGISADLLEGGFKAWESMSFPSTESVGLKADDIQYISYQDLKNLLTTENSVVFVDLRIGKKTGDKKNAEILADITEQFPSVSIIGSATDKKLRPVLAEVISLSNSGNNNLYILVDNGDNRAERAVRRLWAAGVKRTAILAGGEQILERRGYAGEKTVIRDGQGAR